MHNLRIPLVILWVVMVSTACSDDADPVESGQGTAATTDSTSTTEPARTAEEQALIDAMVQADVGDEGVGGPGMAALYRCIDEELVAQLGLDRLSELGVTVEEIEVGTSPMASEEPLESAGWTREDATVVADAALGCGFADTFVTEHPPGVRESAIDCYIDGMTDSEVFHDGFIDLFLTGDGTAVSGVFSTLQQGCFTPEEQEIMMGTSG